MVLPVPGISSSHSTEWGWRLRTPALQRAHPPRVPDLLPVAVGPWASHLTPFLACYKEEKASVYFLRTQEEEEKALSTVPGSVARAQRASHPGYRL